MDRAAQARAFIADTTADPLGLAFRIAVLRGLRRGEICGLRWCDIDLDAGTISVEQTVLQLGGRVVTGGRPKPAAASGPSTSTPPRWRCCGSTGRVGGLRRQGRRRQPGQGRRVCVLRTFR